MNRTRTTRPHRRPPTSLLLPGILLLGLAACAAEPPAGGQSPGPGMGPVDRSSPHDWPPVSLDSSGPEHTVVLQAPDPGWWIQLDGVEASPGLKRIYVTIRRPKPGRMYPQVITELRLGSTVPSREPAELLVRVAEPDGSTPSPYHPLDRSE
ncbi:MAG: hypothetical protein IPJ41_05785 [Phycisphaerales bacterium]|nr:hypothetical protein [Phycisphaerales bacterium]